MSVFPDSGASVTLCHLRVAARTSVELNGEEGKSFDLFDDQGLSMEVAGTCFLHIFLKILRFQGG